MNPSLQEVDFGLRRSILKMANDAVFTLGHAREKQLEGLRVVGKCKSGYFSDISHTNTGYGSDFMDVANHEYLEESYDFLSGSHGSLGFDRTDEYEEDAAWYKFLAGIDSDLWDSFISDMEGLDNYPVLDEDRMSELEMEALDEWMADDGIKELRKELKKQEAHFNSLNQFVLDHLPDGRFYTFFRDSEVDWSREEQSCWMDVDDVAETVEAEEIFQDDAGRDTRPRYERHFRKVQKFAWNHHLRGLLVEALERHLAEHPDVYAAFKKLNDDALYRFVFDHTPLDAWRPDGHAEESLSWYEVVLRTSTPDTYPVEHRTLWTVALEDGGKPEEAIEALVAEFALSDIPRMAARMAALDPRQLKLPNFESSDGLAESRVLRSLLRDSTPVVYEDNQFKIYEPQSLFAWKNLVGPEHDAIRYFADEQQYAYRSRDVRRFAVQDKRDGHGGDIAVVSFSTYGEADLIDHHARELFDDPEGVASVSKFFAERIRAEDEEDRTSFAKAYATLNGMQSLEPFVDLLDVTDFPVFYLFCGVDAGLRGDLQRAKKYLRSKNVMARKTGVWLIFDDWEGTVDLFEKESRGAAEKVFSFEMYDWFEWAYTVDVDQHDLGYVLEPKHYELIRSALPGRKYKCVRDYEPAVTGDPDDVVRLTREIVADWKEGDILEAVSEYEEWPDLEEVWDALTKAYRQATETAAMDATTNGYQQAVIDALGATKHKWIKVKGAKGSKERLGFFCPWVHVKSALEAAGEDGDEYVDLCEAVIHGTEKITPQDDYGAHVVKGEYAYIFDEALGELEPKPVPEDPNQLPLPLESSESAMARVSALLEKKYDYGCLSLDLPKETADFLQMWSRTNIPDEALYVEEDGGKGRETESHVTVKYGLHEEEPSLRMRSIVGNTKAFPVQLGAVSLFTDNPKYDVVKLGVKSPWLRALNARVRGSLPNTETYPTYQPHCTLAYVRKGSCTHLEGMEVFGHSGSPRSTFYVYELKYSAPGEDDDPNRRTTLYLTRENSDKPALVPESVDPFGEVPFPADSDRVPTFRKRKAKKKQAL